MESTRKLISNNERKISILQIIGFCLIFLGVIYFVGRAVYDLILINRLPPPNITAEEVSIMFFIIMLGFSLAFPDLLKDENKGLSTMRMVVFMMVNVICLLFLKIGWACSDLTSIGVNQYWVGIIAFVFGAKAVQSFFESKMAIADENVKKGMASVEYSNADIAKLAVAQNEQFLKTRFSNIASVSDAVDNLNNVKSHVVALYLKDDNTNGIPDHLEVKMPDGSVTTIRTEIITDVGDGSTHASQYDSVQTHNGLAVGSICCIVKTSLDTGIVTAGHVYSNDKAMNYRGWLSQQNSLDVCLNGNNNLLGKWWFQKIEDDKDIAIIKVTDKTKIDNNYLHFDDYYKITDKDIGSTKVVVVSYKSNPQVREGYILDYYTNWDVDYDGTSVPKSGIIVIGSDAIRQQSYTLSEMGDSGGCVYKKNTNKLIGLILGGNKRFTWVLPIKEILDYYGFSLA